MKATAAGVDERTAALALLTPEGQAAPWEHYAVLRAAGPVVVSGGRMLVVDYTVAQKFLGHPALHNRDSTWADATWPDWSRRPASEWLMRSMLCVGPGDRPTRGLCGQRFLPRRVEDLRPAVAAVVRRHVGEFAGSAAGPGSADAVSGLARPVSAHIIGGLMDLPEPDREHLAHLGAAFAQAAGFDPPGDAAADAAVKELAAYLAELVERRRGGAGDDLLSEIIEGWHGTPERLLANILLLFSAAIDTTASLIGSGLLHLMTEPRRRDRLSRDPVHRTAFVQEVLRYRPPVRLIGRWATRDVTIAGTPVPAGTLMVALVEACNRDPSRYSDAERFVPERFVPGESAAVEPAPLSFGAGGHRCLGATLGELAGTEAIAQLAALPGRFVPVGPLEHELSALGNTCTRQPVRFEADA